MCHRMTGHNWMSKVIASLLFVALASGPALARTQLKNICRIKGQESNTLTGQGLVLGLNGTGEAGDVLTMQAVAKMRRRPVEIRSP